MSFETIRQGTLEYLSSTLLETPHGFSTRRGGVSRGTLSSLNLGTHRGDDPENVLENYRILGNALGFAPEDTVFTRQLHGAVVAPVGRDDRGVGLFRPVEPERDALVTHEPGVTLTIFMADCTPILFYDPVHRCVGAAHAGWRGTALAIAARTVETMVRQYGSRPEDIRCAIGPCISGCCFETRRDVPDAMVAAFGADAEAFITGRGEKYHVDLKGINAMILRKSGVTQVDVCAHCTACQPDLFWSHRVTGGDRGSLAAVIRLEGRA